MNEERRSPQATELLHDKRTMDRLLVFFALVYVVEGVGQIEITYCEFELPRDVTIMHGCPQKPVTLGMRLDASGGKKRA